MKYSLILVFVIVTIFTVSLTENLQSADGMTQTAKRLVYNINLGEIQSQIWTLTNDEASPVILEIYATGPGAELLDYKQIIHLEPATFIDLEVFATIPVDHPDNIEYHPDLFALKRGVASEGATGMVVNVQMKTTPYIIIGENPIYTPPPVISKQTIPEPTTPKIEVVEPVKETMQERLDKIQAANEANKKEIPEETEPVIDNEPESTVLSMECGWFDIILSWFGIGKC